MHDEFERVRHWHKTQPRVCQHRTLRNVSQLQSIHVLPEQRVLDSQQGEIAVMADSLNASRELGRVTELAQCHQPNEQAVYQSISR